MTRVTVITGGAGGMGTATAAIVGRDHAVVLADVRAERLDAAVAALKDRGISATGVPADVTDPDAVGAVFDTASGLGELVSVIHTAGVSPSMGDADYVMRTNAVGTATVGERFHASAPPGAALVNVASMAAYLLPAEMIPAQHFPVALSDPAAFLEKMRPAWESLPEEYRSGIAYGVSKSFVRWYSSAQAERFTAKGLRVLSISPGSTDTEMGRLEENAGAGAMVADAAVPRWGTPEEMAELLAFCAGDKAGYLTGTDILNDGGVVASVTERARVAASS
ncbi:MULTISPECIES: SDR family oxidoreductase [Mycolicibacterium]|uniref:SDR family oxidoreductase n=1 Tax=Mycolicibacterium TaxID=1866885 RepID=UPI001EF40D8D|nr:MULTISPECIES: SDR family oxidoreductase [Mycolicibacterium]MCG7580940.1 SDR family oxidoreductase [Mycolicibacterium sp. OfavD-34-C]